MPGETKPNRPKVALIVFIGLLILAFFSLPSANGIAAGIGEKDALKQKYPRIETKLVSLSQIARSKGMQSAQQKAQHSGIQVIRRNSIDVIIETQKGHSLDEFGLKQLNGKVLGSANNYYEVRLPIEQITRLPEKLKNIRFVRLPHKPVALGVEYGTILSEGVNLTGGSLFHSKNLLGQDVKIAIIDVGFVSFSYAKKANEFPEGTVVDKKDYVGNGLYKYKAHGTTVAEIVHDMAPKANLYLKRIADEVDLMNATNDAISQGVDIIVHSVGWLNTNFGDGTGVIADTARKATEAGILWVNAAGNSAQTHWEGAARDDNDNGWVEFENGDETLAVDAKYPSTPITAYLTWNDWPESDKDFELFLYDKVGNRLSTSQNPQTGVQPPAEALESGFPSKGKYQLKIKVPDDGRGTELEIFSNYNLDPVVGKSSVMAPGNVESVLTVGAINRRNWKDGSIEPFSSRGPTSDGRIKPDITAVDGVTTYLRANFLGTSAAAPYVGGAAALVYSQAPNSTPAEVKQALYAHAQDLGATGNDSVYGKGKMRLIYKATSASRTIEPPEEGNINPGDQFTVTVTASMPLTLNGGIEIKEKIPAPFEIVKIPKPKSLKKSGPRTITNSWPLVSPGGTRTIKYRVLVPKDTPPGDYEFTGFINGNTVQGASTAEVYLANQDPNGENAFVIEDVNAAWNKFNNQVEFEVLGENIDGLKVIIYSSNGEKIYTSGWREGPVFQWNLLDENGNAVPNGVYISYALVKGTNGNIKSSELNKTLVLR